MIWTVVSSIASSIAAVAAAMAVYHSRRSWQEDRAAKRPYFIIAKPGIRELAGSPPYRIQITMENRGVHSASQCEGRIFIIDATLEEKVSSEIRFSVANAIPSCSPTPWYNDNVDLPRNVPPQFVVLGLNYWDPILNKQFGQVFFMRWDGVRNGITHPDFVYVSGEGDSRISEYLGERLDEITTERMF